MITLPPYLYDREVYAQVPQEDRWILNKLHLAEALGYNCGPCGVSAPAGRYCLRPMNSVRGMGYGGFFDITIDNVTTFLPIIPGYFWCEWFDGEHRLTHFVDDVPVHSSASRVTAGRMATRGNTKFGDLTHAVTLPAFLGTKSKYLIVESLDDKIIDVAFRGAGANARQEIIDDYKKVDPGYDPQDIKMGNSDFVEEVYSVTDELGNTYNGNKWKEDESSRRPFDT